MKKIIALAILAVYLAGCAAAANYRPIIDTHGGIDAAKYEADLADCQRYAQRIDPAGQAVAGAIIGALLMGAMGAAIGDRRGEWFRAGAVAGGAGAASGGIQAQIEITKRCMAGRGYAVLQ